MLSVIRSTANKEYVLFVQGDPHEGFAAQLTDGAVVYRHEGRIRDETHKPQSRSRESALSYMQTLHTALCSPQSQSARETESGSSSRFVFDIHCEEDALQLLVKERVSNTNALSILFRGKFVRKRESDDDTVSDTHTTTTSSSPPIVLLLREIESVLRVKHERIATLTAENASYQSLNAQYTQDIEMLRALKDSLQDSMIQRMCVILNSKKMEIQRLQGRVEELAAAASSSSSSSSSAVPVAAHATATTTKARAGATRGRPRKASEPSSSSPPSTTKTKRGTSRSSADVIQKKSASAKSRTTTTAKPARRGKRVTQDSDEDDDEDEENDEDRAFIADDDEEDDDDGEGERDGGDSRSESEAAESPLRDTRSGRGSTRSAPSSTTQSLHVVDSMETAPLPSGSTQRGGKRSASAAFLSQDSDWEGGADVTTLSTATLSANIPSSASLPLASSSLPLSSSSMNPTATSTAAVAATAMPAAKKKKSERFLDSDDDDDEGGCLSFL